MKLIKKSIERDKSGYVVLYPEEPEDMWHLYNLISVGDQIRANTERKIQLESSLGNVQSQRIRLTLNISVEKLDFDAQAVMLRLNGRVVLKNEHVPVGSYHTIDLALFRNFTLIKSEWESVFLDRISNICDVDQRAEIVAVVMQEGVATICLVTEYLTVVKEKVEVNIPKKKKNYTSAHEKSFEKFFDQILKVLDTINCDVVKCLIIAGTGDLKDEFNKYLVKKGCTKFYNNKKLKILLLTSTSGYKNSLDKLLEDPEVQNKLSETKYAREVAALNEFYSIHNFTPDKVAYGYDHVSKVCELGAIATLLVTDSLFRSIDVTERKKYIKLVDSARDMGAKIFVFSSLHASGDKLNSLTGIAAVLHYSIPLEEDEQILK
jgi:protein pelota